MPGKTRFFSIVIPAHNESAVIDHTLTCVKALEYPKDRYEVIVVENGSADDTLAKARRHASGLPPVSVYHAETRGVSKARNFGLRQISPSSEWTVTMDADVTLGATFLTELNDYLERHPGAGYGMPALLPDNRSFAARISFWYRNLNVKLIKSLDTVHIVRRDLVAGNSYPEDFNFTEDLQYAERFRGKAPYFFLRTKSVVVSTRRYEALGYWRLFVKNLCLGFRYAFNRQSLVAKDWQTIR